MKIAYFVNQYPTASHSFIRREIRALEARGHHVSRYALSSCADTIVDPEDQIEQLKTKHLFRQSPLSLCAAVLATALAFPRGLLGALHLVLRIGPGSDRGLLRHLAYIIEGAIVAHWCRLDCIEHLHAHFGGNSAAIALFAHKICGVEYSLTVHGPDEFDRPLTIALREKIHYAAFVVAVSSFGRSQLMRWVDVGDWRKLEVVHCGISKDFRLPPVSPDTEERRLVCVGRLVPQKGHLILLSAAHMLFREGLRFRLVFAGDGPLRSEIEHKASELGLDSQLCITGWAPGECVIAELRRACAMVLPSIAEGLPVAIMEAMALRRPVISTFIAGIPELIIPGETGWLVPAGDTHALAAAMREALTADPGRLAVMGDAACRRVFERHAVETEAAKLENLMLKRGSHDHRDDGGPVGRGVAAVLAGPAACTRGPAAARAHQPCASHAKDR